MNAPNDPQQTSPAAPSGYHFNLRGEMLGFLPQKVSRVLEVGCAAGRFGEALKQRYQAEVWGLEYDATVAEQARPRLDRVLVGDGLEQLGAMPDGHFDLVVCNDVLEHMAYPGAFLRGLKPKFAAGGTLVSSIPNVRYWHALKRIVLDRDFPTEDEGIFDRTHLRFFTRLSIERLHAESGYGIERIEGINATRARGLRVLNALTFGAFEDCRYLQYATVAKPLV